MREFGHGPMSFPWPLAQRRTWDGKALRGVKESIGAAIEVLRVTGRRL
jgi:hypothetical protein